MNDKKVLIVDFDPESLVALSNLVYEEGFQAETATDGLTAYEKFRSGLFDLVILEPMLPKLHGFELCKRIVNDPERHVPVMIVTAIYREPQCKHDALTVNGAAAFFTKPYDREELRSKMLQLLVEGRSRSEHRAEPIASAPAPPRPQVQPHSPHPAGQKFDLRELLEAAPAHREIRTAKTAADIEKELQDAVSGLVGTAKKKEPVSRKEPDVLAVKEEFRNLREKRETRSNEELDIDSLLKDAIGGLAVPQKKPVDPPRKEPVVRPAPAPRVEPRIEPRLPSVEKIPVADEIKRHLPLQPGKPNNVPHPAARAELGRTAVPFDIDKTLIEIDQIPLEHPKPAREEVRSEATAGPVYKKSSVFEEFEEPARTRPKAAVIGAVAGLLVLAGAGFLVLKPKKPGTLPTEAATAAESRMAAEAVTQPPDSKFYPDTAGAELKPEPRKVVKPAPEKPETIGAPIQPQTPAEGALVSLRDEPAVSIPAAPLTSVEAPPAAQAASAAPQEPAPKPQGQAEAAAAAAAGQPAAPKAREGQLVDLAGADAAPILIKRQEPRYPPLALRSGASGTVTVNALISETGDVLRTEILKGIKDGFGLEEAAEAAIRQWKFRPARKDGVNVRVWKAIDITFKQNIKKR